MKKLQYEEYHVV